MKQISPDSFVPQAVETAAQRGKGRDSLMLAAALTIDGRVGLAQVRVRNLSTGGLMAEYPHPLEIGTAVTVELRGIGKVEGTVAWTAAGRIGIAFAHPIDPMKARKPVVPPQAAPARDKPIKPIF